MVKRVLGVILGYVVMAAILFGGLTAAYLAMGADKAFQPGSYETSMIWNIIFLPVGIIAAIAGGFFCRKFTKSCGATMSLAVLVFLFGALSAVFMVLENDEPPVERTAEVGNFEAMISAQQPMWAAFANPVVGAMGVMVGGCLAGKKKRKTEIS